MSLSIYQKKLLHNLVSDQKKFNKKLYSAGPYWDYKTKKILYLVVTKGITNVSCTILPKILQPSSFELGFFCCCVFTPNAVFCLREYYYKFWTMEES